MSTPQHHPQYQCARCGELQICGTDNHLWPSVGVHHRHHHQECPAEDVLPVPALSTTDSLLLCSHPVRHCDLMVIVVFINYIDFSHHLWRMNQFCGLIFHSLGCPCFQLQSMSDSAKAVCRTESNLNTWSAVCVFTYWVRTADLVRSVAEWSR